MLEEYRLGVMQGRLLPKYQGRYQAHPIGYWQDEFQLAKSIGLDSIEFILDYNDSEKNPLLSDQGISEIQTHVENTGVKIRSICADYFMEAPLHSGDKKVLENSLSVMKKLIHAASKLDIQDIVLPCVDQSSLKSEAASNQLIEVLQDVKQDLIQSSTNLALETDLPPAHFANLIEQLGTRPFTVNYDTGNSAALGFDINEEFAAYGSVVTDIHIKDRVLGGGPVELGTGDTNFSKFEKALETLNYEGLIIMQAYRDEEGVAIFKKQLDWLKNF